MAKTIVLDTGVLGLVTHPRVHGDFRSWFEERLSGGARFCVPEISDYELRRELIRAGKAESVRRLDDLEQVLVYLILSAWNSTGSRRYRYEARQSNLQTPISESQRTPTRMKQCEQMAEPRARARGPTRGPRGSGATVLPVCPQNFRGSRPVVKPNTAADIPAAYPAVTQVRCSAARFHTGRRRQTFPGVGGQARPHRFLA